MDEYITWSDELKQFGDNITLKELLKDVCETWDVYEVEEGKYFRNIGLKDINGKNIYADCSIVEFNNSTNLSHKYKGIFYYLPAKARYMIKVFNKNNFEIWFYNPDKILNLQIVDTLQQNKLRLIK